MKTKSFKQLAEALNRNDGVSLTAIIALLVIMSVMSGVFSSIMGRWKLSAPANMNSSKAFYLAETAAMFALQDAKYRFYGGSFNFGTNDSPYVVSSGSTEEADYWFERPDLDDDDDDDSTSDDASSDDSSSDSSDSESDDNSNDDADDVSDPTRYTIIATGKVLIDGTTTTIAKRQIKIKATITDSSGDPVDPGIHAEGSIRGSGSGAFQIWQDGLDVATDTPSVTFSNGTYTDSGSGQYSGSRTDVVYQATAFGPPDLDEEFFKAIAVDQGHTNPSISNNSTYPVGSSSYYYDAPTNTIPNITYISGDLDVNNVTLYGIYYITGAVTMQGNMHVEGIIIGNSTIKLSASNAASDPHLDGGIIQLGSGQVWGAGNPTTIQINDAFFDALNATIPIITIVSSQEAVSAN